VSLSGTSTSKAPSCPTSGGPTPGGGKGDLKGSMTITINRIALVSSGIPTQPITTDTENTVEPFVPPDVPVIFDSSANAVTLPQIGDDVQFNLPQTKTNPLHNLINGTTVVTSTADVTGTYGDDGSVELKNVPIHLSECFETDFTVTLTTG